MGRFALSLSYHGYKKKMSQAMKRNQFCALIAAIIMLLALPAPAQDSIKVSLVTVYPGSKIFEVYGHTELRVTDSGSDLYYNYGLFDFGQGFVWRFVRGETDYLCGAIPSDIALFGYGQRKVVEQELNLDQEQAATVRALLRENALPENATYRYKFFSDNCATRPRDLIEQAAGNALRYASPSTGHVTYRDMMSQYNGNYSWERLGIDLTLGASVDTAITSRQADFLPMQLMERFAYATIAHNGVAMPLVRDTKIVIDGSEQGTILPPTPWYASPLALSLLLLALTALATWTDWRRKRVSRWVDSIVFIAYGAAGCLIFFLIFISTHEGTSPNYNGFWLHPLYLVPAVLVWVKKGQRLLLCYHAINALELGVFIVLAPFLPQHFNVAFYPLMLAVMLRMLNYILISRHSQVCYTPSK